VRADDHVGWPDVHVRPARVDDVHVGKVRRAHVLFEQLAHRRRRLDGGDVPNDLR
jgi:hypothetical protein